MPYNIDDTSTINTAHEPIFAYLSLKLGYDSVDALTFIKSSYIETIERAAIIFGVSQRTIQDWGRKLSKLNPLYGDTLIELEEIKKVGLLTFGEDETALRDWMHTPLAAYGARLPIDLLDNTIGRKLVIDTLIGYQHGVFA